MRHCFAIAILVAAAIWLPGVAHGATLGCDVGEIAVVGATVSAAGKCDAGGAERTLASGTTPLG